MSFSEYHESLWQTVPVGLQPQHLALRLAFLLKRVGSGERVLDVGCGEGHFACELAVMGTEVVGIDVAREPLRRAHLRDPDLDVRLVSPAGQWPVRDASFDVVWAGEVIEHVQDTAAWLSEVRRVLRPGGRLLLSTPAHSLLRRLALALSGRAFEAHFDPLSDHLRFYTARSLSALLEDFGFSEIEIKPAGASALARAVLLASARRSRF
ncbi:MAG TPA: class I SAM-dependent methyltransferase [Solirubrobacteraceae bacterium]